MKRRLTVRRAAAAAILPLALTTLVACGDDEPTSSDDSSTSSTAEDTTDETPAGDDASEETPAESTGGEPAAGEQIQAADLTALFQSAFANATTATMTMTMDTAGQKVSSEGAVDYSTTPPAMTMTMEIAGQKMDMRMVDGAMYMSMPQLGDKFIKLDLDDPSNPLGAGLTDQLDPRQQFETMSDSIESATFVGEEDGLRHYTMVANSAALLESMDEDAQAGAGAQLPDSITYDIWFDNEGLLRKMVTDMGVGSIEMRLDDWGSDVTIEAPSDDQITTMPGT